MRIVGAKLFPLDYPFVGGGYATSYGARTHLNNALVALEAEDGTVGYGEISRVTGASPRPTDPDQVAQAEGAIRTLLNVPLAAPRDVASLLSGGDSRNLTCSLETALLDLQAKTAGVPLSVLFGGMRRDSVPCYYSIGQAAPDEIAARLTEAAGEGYRILQVKIGGDPATDTARVAAALDAAPDDAIVLPDANGGLSPSDAEALIARFDDPRLYWEEPCKTYEENRLLAERSGARLLLDQCMAGLDRYLDVCREGFAAAVGLKATILGSPVRARIARDLCVEHGIRLKVDDSWGADIGTALALHLALGVPGPLLLSGVDMRLYFDGRCDPAGPSFAAAELQAGQGLGLGISPDPEALGPPIVEIR